MNSQFPPRNGRYVSAGPSFLYRSRMARAVNRVDNEGPEAQESCHPIYQAIHCSPQGKDLLYGNSH